MILEVITKILYKITVTALECIWELCVESWKWYKNNIILVYIFALISACFHYFDIAIVYSEQNPSFLSLIGYQFSHANLPHLIGNMFVFLLVGPAVEKNYGKIGFAFIYLVCGAASALGFASLNPGTNLIGASGAIAGMMAIYPFTKETLLATVCSGFALLGIFYSDFANMFSPFGSTAHMGHIAGGVCGLVLISFLNKKRL